MNSNPHQTKITTYTVEQYSPIRVFVVSVDYQFKTLLLFS